MSTYPEHEKLKALNGANQTVADFIQWLSDNGYALCKPHPSNDQYWPVQKSTSSFIAEFFEIDENKLEQEKQAMLDSLRT